MWKSKGVRLMVAGLLIISVLMGGGCGMFNKPPVINSLIPSATTVARGESCTISCAATDPDADILTYAWSVTGGAISGEGDTVTWVAPDTEGAYTISVTVSDDSGESASDSCTIDVVNSPPVIASLVPSALSVAPEESCTVSCDASDADGDALTYEWSFTSGEIYGAGSTVTWTAPDTEGIYAISVTVSDGRGGTAGASCEIAVEMRFGAIDIKSDPAGAMVYLNGVDTGNITPYVITNLAPGTYTVKLEYYHYQYKEGTVTVNADKTTYINWSLTYAPEETATIQPGSAEGIDTYVYDPTPDDNYGSQDELYAGARAAGICRSYLQFDLDSLPEGAVITSARLWLYYFYNVPGHAAEIGVFPVLEAWTEGGVTWDDQPTFAEVPEYTRTLPATPTDDFYYWVITELVRAWFDGNIQNYGMVLASADEDGWEGWVGFLSSDGVATYRPKLVITYYVPTS
jgi:hypothetical protein